MVARIKYTELAWLHKTIRKSNEVTKETLRPLALLFPRFDSAAEDYCVQLQTSFDIDLRIAPWSQLKTKDA